MVIPLWLVILMGVGDMFAIVALAWFVAILIEGMRSGALLSISDEKRGHPGG